MAFSASRHRRSNWGDRDISNPLRIKEEGFEREELENNEKLQEGFLLLLFDFAWQFFYSDYGKGLTRRVETVVRL